MPFSRRRLFPVAIVVAAAACAGSAAGDSASVALRAPNAAGVPRACGLRLPPPVRGELAFRIPSGGRAARRRLAGRLALCTLFRRDGSRFARLYSDSHQRVLSVAFFRPSGVLRSASDAVYAVTPAETGSDVKCDSSSQASIGKHVLADDEEVVDRRDGAGDQPRHGCPGRPKRAEPVDEQHQLVRHQGPGEPARALRGQDISRSQARRLQHGRLGQPEERPGLQRGARVHRDRV